MTYPLYLHTDLYVTLFLDVDVITAFIKQQKLISSLSGMIDEISCRLIAERPQTDSS